MAANLGSLVANITANTKPFSKGMKTAGGDLSKMQQSANSFSLKSMIAKIGLAAGAAMAFGKAIAGVKDQMAELDKLGKTADKLGIGVQELERLRYSASLAGIEAASFDKSLEKMARGVSEAAHGMGTAKHALDDLGISAAELMQQSPDQQMMTLANAIKKIQNPAEKARVAYQIFGRAGVDMVNMLNQGSDAIEEQGKKFDELNGVMSRADIKAVEAANDAWTDTKIAIKGAWREFTIAIAPVLKGLAKVFTWVVKIGKILLGWSPPILMFKFFKEMFGKKKKLDKWRIEGLEKQKNKLDKWRIEGLEKQKEITPLLEDQLEKEKAIADEKAKAADALKKQGEAITREFMTPQEQFEEKVADLNRLVNAGAISWNIYNKAIGKAVDELKQANKQTDRLANPRKPIAAARRGTSAAFSAQRQSERHLKEMRDKQKQQVEEQKKTNQILANIDRNRSDLKVVNL
tara:strand:+ start:635 stop:2023 length:1389 start_codon:yes stop_codon:yes gene_type:complete